MKKNKSAETKRLYLNSFYLVILRLIIYNKIYNEGIIESIQQWLSGNIATC